MKYEEALKALQYLISGESSQYPPDYDMPIRIAIEALEKQIKKRPLRFGDDAYLCPACKRNNFYEGTEFLHRQKRCSVCGQAIFWEDGE